MSEVGPTVSRSRAYEKYRLLETKIFMTIQEAEALSRDLASEILAMERPDLLVGIANGGLLPTTVVADYMGIPFHIIRVRRRGSRYKQRIFDIFNTLRIPNSILRLRPVSYVTRRFTERYDELEEAKAFDFCVRNKSVVLVDDAIYTGKSVRHVQEQLIKNGAAKVTTAVLCWYRGKGDSGNWSPNFYLVRQDHFYPWSYSSPYLSDYLAWLSAHDLFAST
jgi:hypoxanthine phosphoribosyltransferase